MAHYAKVNNGIVEKVIVAEADFFNTFVDSSPGEWIQTSYNTFGNQHPNGTPLRGNFASIGFTYDKENDVFYAPKPYPSYILNTSTWLWETPVPMPTDGKVYVWDESIINWKEVA